MADRAAEVSALPVTAGLTFAAGVRDDMTVPISDQQRAWLEQQLTDWQAGQLISDVQAAQIRAQYESAEEFSRRKKSLFSFVIQGLAALLIGLALFLLIGYNWDALSRTTKLLLIFGVVLATHAGGLYLRFVRQAPRASEIVFFLGCLFYGTAIWLVGQVFHLDAHYPDGVWWWAVGVLPFAVCLDSLLLHVLLVGLLGLWAGMEVIGFSNLGVRLFRSWWMVPNGAYSLPLLALPGLAWAYAKRSAAAVGLYAPLLAWWAILQALVWDLEWQTVHLVGMLGAVMLIIAECHRAGSPLAIPIRRWGVVQVAGTLALLSFSAFQREIVRSWGYDFSDTFVAGIAEFLALIVLLAATLGIAAWFQSPRSGSPRQALARVLELARRQGVPVALALFFAGECLWTTIVGQNASADDRALAWIVPTVAANVGMIVFAFWLMRVGLREDRGKPFSFGVLYFLLWAVLRYADLFAEAGGMLGAALMFFLCGAALFGVGMFWRGRKHEVHRV